MYSFIIISSIYWISVVAWFSIVQKSMFVVYNCSLSSRPIGLRDVVAVYRHGTVSDAIVASYLTSLPLIAGFAATLVPAVDFSVVMVFVNVVASIAVGLLVTADTVLYKFWKFKIDASVFAYLRSLKGATASVSTLYIVTAVAVWSFVSATFFFMANCACGFGLSVSPIAGGSLPWWGYPVVVVALALAVGVLFLVIRGLGIRPNNPSLVYFSNNQFLNHWALNPGYNMIYSLTTRNDFAGQFHTMDSEECESIVGNMFPTDVCAPSRKLFCTDRPDILLIVWESLGVEFTGVSGIGESVTPNLDVLAREGILFADCTAGSFRTDRGLVCLLSGYPAQPTTSVIRYTRKLPNLPGLPRTLRQSGYYTTAVHGGDLTIMHKSDYYLASGHDRLISQKDFPSGAQSCKWGVHDGPVMDFVADEAIRLAAVGHSPWFMTVQTLSSHEPFNVPETITDDKVRNAFAYSDRALGRLVDRLKASPLWDNLLIIVAADHGLNLPRPVDDRRTYSHIPIVMGGGAVARPTRIDTMMSQTDLAATLLGQLGVDHSDFVFSRDVLSDTYKNPFGLHVFNNGIMLSDTDGYTVLDTALDKVIEGDTDPVRIRRMRAILQKIYEDLDKR